MFQLMEEFEENKWLKTYFGSIARLFKCNVSLSCEITGKHIWYFVDEFHLAEDYSTIPCLTVKRLSNVLFIKTIIPLHKSPAYIWSVRFQMYLTVLCSGDIVIKTLVGL